jgi:hypothetical protein
MIDIRGWRPSDVLSLPDQAFGERTYVSVGGTTAGVGVYIWASTASLPDRAMIWRVAMHIGYGLGAGCYVRLALGDAVPASEAAMAALEPLLPGVGVAGTEPRAIWCPRYQIEWNYPLRRLVDGGVHRKVIVAFAAGVTLMTVSIDVLVSAVPDEVPAWLI